jgi:hypothetical protein
MNGTHHKNKAGIIALVIILIIQGCASTPSSYQPNEVNIGTLRVLGNNDVWVNKGKAEDNQLISSGDRIKVGALSNAYLYYISEGFVHFDENTDPVFDLVWDRTQCFISIFHFDIGQIYVDDNKKCPSVVSTPHVKIKPKGTDFNLRVGQQQTVLTVLGGSVELLTSNPMLLTTGQQITVSRSGAGQIVQLTKAELDAVIQWRKKYPPPEEPSTWSKVWPVVAAVVVVTGAVVGILAATGGGKNPPPENPKKQIIINNDRVFK